MSSLMTGILKNPSSTSTTRQSTSRSESSGVIGRLEPDRQLSEKDLTLKNTLQNAGHRRSSSNPRPGANSRRQSSLNSLRGMLEDDDDEGNNARLKWDEANLYLTEQEKSSTMRIDEPKTPYARRYEPDEDEEEDVSRDEGLVPTLDADDIVVDELDQVGQSTLSSSSKGRTREEEIPGLELGEPEEAIPEHIENDEAGDRGRISGGSGRQEKQVVVDPEVDDGLGGHGEIASSTDEEREKHRIFEEMRKKHYEMKDVKGLLGCVLTSLLHIFRSFSIKHCRVYMFRE